MSRQMEALLAVHRMFEREEKGEPAFEVLDFDVFSSLATSVYHEIADSPYALNEVLFVFRYFFEQYRDRFGDHPPIKREQIERLIRRMPYPTEYIGGLDVIEPVEYFDIIDTYFESDFKNCNYRINHFFSGKIRLIARTKVERNKI